MSLKEKLSNMKAEIVARSGDTKKGLEVQNSADLIDRSVNEANRMAAASLGDRDRSMILALETALERIEGGGYGICDRCEVEIAPRRLECVPWATLCMSCQEHEEKKPELSKPVKRLADHGREIEAEARRRMVTDII